MYKEKVLKAYQDLTKRINLRIAEKKNAQEELVEVTAELHTLEKLFKSSEEKIVKKALQKQVDENTKRMKYLSTVPARMDEYLQELYVQLSFFRNEICPHENSKETGFDYHKRETEYTCDLCGKSW